METDTIRATPGNADFTEVDARRPGEYPRQALDRWLEANGLDCADDLEVVERPYGEFTVAAYGDEYEVDVR